MDPEGASTPGEGSRTQQQVDNAIRAIREKKPLPEIDFTIHTMEDGTQVNTMERVCKGTLDTLSTLLPASSSLRVSSAMNTLVSRLLNQQPFGR